MPTCLSVLFGIAGGPRGGRGGASGEEEKGAFLSPISGGEPGGEGAGGRTTELSGLGRGSGGLCLPTLRTSLSGRGGNIIGGFPPGCFPVRRYTGPPPCTGPPPITGGE